MAATDGALSVQCAHDGYRRLPGGPLHRRWWELRDNVLIIFDRIQGPFSDAVAYFHFHSKVNLSIDDNGQSGTLYLTDGRAAQWNILQGVVRLQPSTYHPQFGASETSHCLVVEFADTDARIVLCWK